MHRTRKPLASKKLDLRRETLRRLDNLSDADLGRVGGGLSRYPSNVTTTTTKPNDGCD